VLPLLIVVMPLQLLTGDLSAKHLAVYQPVKLAAADIHVPKLLSFMAHGDLNAKVIGLKDFEPDLRPPVLIPHLAFQVMVGCGMLMLALVAWAAFLLWRRRPLETNRRFLRAALLVAPLGLIAVEAGWIVTEVGRQPWIIQGVLRVKDAVTPMPGLQYSLFASIAVYLLLGSVVAVLLYRQVLSTEPARRSSPTTVTEKAPERQPAE
jgi:cytochrome bd ubiquinol oxidase subunit I